MADALERVGIIILAAGKGKRMYSELPKVLLPLADKPMISYIVKAIKGSMIKTRPVIVVGKDNGEEIKKALNGYEYALQDKQLGTGHAVICARPAVYGKFDTIMVLYGDHPLVSSEMIDKIVRTHFESGKVLTMATVKVTDFQDWQQAFYDYGRIVRDSQGKVQKIVETRDASEEEKNILEVNPSYFCFQTDWLWNNLAKLGNNNAQGEYYLTDLVGIAQADGLDIATVEINPKEALGANTADQLAVLQNIIEKDKSS
ncbi:MAG: NTP transferase domain-containing protein [bacterium]|nr:NTP transferase domain-containing protein [bacterium]